MDFLSDIREVWKYWPLKDQLLLGEAYVDRGINLTALKNFVPFSGKPFNSFKTFPVHVFRALAHSLFNK